MTKTVCILGTDPSAEGGIASVIRAYLSDIDLAGYRFEQIVTHRDGGKAAKTAIAARALVQFAVGLLRRKYDIVHVHASFGASFARAYPFVRLARRFGVPCIMHVHDSTWQEFYGQASAGKKARIERTYRDCSAVVVLAECWRKVIEADVPGVRIRVLENFCPEMGAGDMPQFANKTVLYIGRVIPFKGCVLIPRIAKRCLEECPDMRFVVAGDGADLVKLRQACEAEGVAGSFSFAGWIGGEEKRRAFGESSVLLLPSEHEAMPLSILEAISLKMPVVASNVGGIPDIVIDGENGFTCEPDDIEAYAQALMRLGSDEGLWAQMSAGAEVVAGRHTIEEYANRLEALYQTIK